jgi:hypothetical protein
MLNNALFNIQASLFICFIMVAWLAKKRKKQKKAKITSEIDYNKSCHGEIAKCILLLALPTKARILCLDSL